MSTGWTAPGWTGQPAGHEPGPANGSGGPAPQPTTGPQRELVQQVPLFPLRPLNVGEVLGAAVRIYRVRPKPVLGLAAAVYGIAFEIGRASCRESEHISVARGAINGQCKY